jgi:hypothetical protein
VVWCSSIRCMRTALSLDDDVLLAVKERARRENRTAGQIHHFAGSQAARQTTSKSPLETVAKAWAIGELTYVLTISISSGRGHLAGGSSVIQEYSNPDKCPFSTLSLACFRT